MFEPRGMLVGNSEVPGPVLGLVEFGVMLDADWSICAAALLHRSWGRVKLL